MTGRRRPPRRPTIPKPATNISPSARPRPRRPGRRERIVETRGGPPPRPRPRTSSMCPAWTPVGHSGDRARPRRLVDAGDEPPGRPGIGVERLDDLGQHDRDLAHPERAVEDRARQGAARGSRELAAGRGSGRRSRPLRRRLPHREPRLALDAVEQVELLVESPRSSRARGGSTRIGSPGRTTPSRITRAYIRESSGWSRIEIRPDLPPTNTCLITSHGLAGAGDLEQQLVADRQPRPTGRQRELDPAVVRFSPTEPGSIAWPSAWTRSIASMASRQTARCGPPWTGVVVVGVAVEPVPSDPRLLDGQLRDAARRDVDLEDLAVLEVIATGRRLELAYHRTLCGPARIAERVRLWATLGSQDMRWSARLADRIGGTLGAGGRGRRSRRGPVTA